MRGGLGLVGAAALVAGSFAIMLVVAVVAGMIEYGVTVPGIASLILVAGAGIGRCGFFLWSVWRSGLGVRMVVDAAGITCRTVDGEAETAPWREVVAVDYGYEDGSGLPRWHHWTIRKRDGSSLLVRYPVGMRVRPGRVRRAIHAAAPTIPVNGDWRDPVVSRGHAPPVESAGHAPAPRYGATVVRGRFGVFFAIGVLGAVSSLFLAVAAFGLTMDPSAEPHGLWPGVLVLAAAGVVLCTALPLRIIRCGRRVHLWASLDELGYRTRFSGDPGIATWDHVIAVQYENEDVRGFVYTHRWRIEFDDRPAVTVQYPAGASVRPWYFRNLLRRLAPHVQVTGGWW